MQNKKWQAYGNNVEVLPVSKEKVIGNTQKYYLLGTVVSKGDKVSTDIEIGDVLGYTLWGVNKIEDANGEEHFYIQDNPDFILAVLKNEA
jgi:hypothetical protein